MEKKPIVKIRLYRGRELNYDANGNIKNENDLVSLEHNSQQWVIFMRNIAISGYCRADVEKVFKTHADGTYEEYKEIPLSFQEEVDKHFQPTKKLPVSPEATRIAELEKKLEFLMSQSKTKKGVDKKDVESVKKEALEVNIQEIEKSQLTEQISEEAKEAIKPKKKKEKSEPTIEDLAVRDKYIEVFGKQPFNGWSVEVMQEKIEAELAKV